MKVKVIYRNYIPLYSGYCSFWLKPIEGVEVIIPKVKKRKVLFKFYRLLRELPLFPLLVAIGQKLFFSNNDFKEGIDMYFYVGLLPGNKISKPFVVDFEHVHSLFNYSVVDRNTKKRVWQYLTSKYCIAILPWSEAALDTLKRLYGRKYKCIENKIELLYPALPLYKGKYKPEYNEVKNNKCLKFLFVGNDYKRKGLIELLKAFEMVIKKYKDVELYVVSGLKENESNKYKCSQIHFFKTRYSQEDVIKKFFLTCNIFVMPTHADTFGMVFLEALSCGLPVITTDQFAAKEIIEEGKNGLFVKSSKLFLDEMLIPDKKHTGEGYNEIDNQLVADLFKKMKYLIDNVDVFNRMKNNTVKHFESRGRFSLETRNRLLENIYKKVV